MFDFISPPLFVYLRINLILTFCSDVFISAVRNRCKLTEGIIYLEFYVEIATDTFTGSSFPG